MDISGYDEMDLRVLRASESIGIGTSTPVEALTIEGSQTFPHNEFIGFNMYYDSGWKKYTSNVYCTAIKHVDTNNRLEIRQAEQTGVAGTTISTWSTGYFSAGTWTDASDDRLKDQETLITDATTTLMKLRPEKYRKLYITEDQNGDEIPSSEGSIQAGLIAQEVYYQAPELRHIVDVPSEANPVEGVTIPEDPTIDLDYEALGWSKKFAGINYTGLIPYLIKMNQEQQARIEALEAQVQALQNP